MNGSFQILSPGSKNDGTDHLYTSRKEVLIDRDVHQPRIRSATPTGVNCQSHLAYQRANNRITRDGNASYRGLAEGERDVKELIDFARGDIGDS